MKGVNQKTQERLEELLVLLADIRAKARQCGRASAANPEGEPLKYWHIADAIGRAQNTVAFYLRQEHL